MCLVTPLSLPPPGWRDWLNRGPREIYNFGAGEQAWQPGPTTAGYLLPEGAAISYPHFPRHWRQNREFAGLLVVKTGHIAVAGSLTGWRLAVPEVTADEAADRESSEISEIKVPKIEGVDRLNEIPRLIIPESRLIPVADWKQKIANWPALHQAHSLPPDEGPQATIRDPARVIQAFTYIRASAGGLS